jgi:hypothetical protein
VLWIFRKSPILFGTLFMLSSDKTRGRGQFFGDRVFLGRLGSCQPERESLPLFAYSTRAFFQIKLHQHTRTLPDFSIRNPQSMCSLCGFCLAPASRRDDAEEFLLWIGEEACDQGHLRRAGLELLGQVLDVHSV